MRHLSLTVKTGICVLSALLLNTWGNGFLLPPISITKAIPVQQCEDNCGVSQADAELNLCADNMLKCISDNNHPDDPSYCSDQYNECFLNLNPTIAICYFCPESGICNADPSTLANCGPDKKLLIK